MRFLVVDNHPVFLDALKAILEGCFEAVEFEGASSLEEITGRDLADYSLVIVDLSFRGKDITKDVCTLIKNSNGARVLVLTNFEDGRHLRMISESGAQGYLPKSTSAEILISVVQLVVAGGRYFPQELAPDQTRGGPKFQGIGRADEINFEPALTQRQIEVLERLAAGSTISELADGLGVSEPTIKADISKATRALAARNRLHAVCRALEAGLIHPELT